MGDERRVVKGRRDNIQLLTAGVVRGLVPMTMLMSCFWLMGNGLHFWGGVLEEFLDT